MKRLVDILFSLTGLLVLAPLFGLLALAIRLDSRGPVFFRQERVGKNFRPFWLWKFRTMDSDAPSRGGRLTIGADQRITRVGALLRRTKLDELPQLVNVVKGDMSLVGPRPEVVEFVEAFHEDFEELLTVRPGVTDPASLKYRDESTRLEKVVNAEQEYLTRILPDKIKLSKAYLAQRSTSQDLLLIIRTLLDAVGARLLPRMIVAHRRTAVVVLHLFLVGASNALAFLVRFDGQIPQEEMSLLLLFLPVLLLVRGVTFAWRRLYQGLWRYTDVWDLRDVFVGVGTSSLLFFAIVQLALSEVAYPRSVFLIDASLLLTMMVGMRLARRVLTITSKTKPARTVLVIGAGDAGETIVRDLKKRGDYEPVGFVDDDPAKADSSIHGVRVLGSRNDLSRIMEYLRPDEVLVALPSASSEVRRELITTLAPFTTRITTLPSLTEVVAGTASATQVRQLSLADLLSRSPVGLAKAPLKGLINGQSVMVTGAGGSIGSELCRQISSLRPASLVLYERYENSLYSIQNELLDDQPSSSVHACVGDITDRSRLDQVFTQHRPTIVFHAAAHKHVSLMEDNPCEAVKNNVRGTRLLAEAAGRHGVDRFIMISSDKAVTPTSVMGATKRVGELMIRAQAMSTETSFSIVRFGNVLGSNGSVLHRFVDQIKAGGPVTVTDPEITLYFMLISEAVELVLHAAAAGQPGATYVLEMGKQIKVLDLARTLIRLSGHASDEIPITFTGRQPGEKMFEELTGSGEVALASGIEKILRVTSSERIDPQALANQVSTLERLADAGRLEDVLSQLKRIEPNFRRTIVGAILAPEVPMTTPAPALVPTGLVCPSCSSAAVQRSRTRVMSERVWRRLTSARPHRCRDCGWRGWLKPVEGPREEQAFSAESESPDFGVLDQAIRSHSLQRRRLVSSVAAPESDDLEPRASSTNQAPLKLIR